MPANLTEKERTLLEAIAKGMDEPGSGWLHELSYRAGITNDHAAAGILGALIEKGLATSDEDREGPVVCHWITITESGSKELERPLS